VSLLAYKLIISPALVVLATLAGRRWGGLATGMVAGLPIVAGPILYFYALEQGPAYAATAVVATLMGMASLSAFLLVYGWRSWSGGTALSSLLMGWTVFAAFTVLINRALQDHSVGLLKALCYALAALYLGRRSLPPIGGATPAQAAVLNAVPTDTMVGSGESMSLSAGQDLGDAPATATELAPPAASPGNWDLALRMFFAALLVLMLTGLAQRLGPRLGGLLTPFPVASTVVVVFAHLQGGRAAARAVLKGLFLSLNSFAVFCAVLAATLTVGGLIPAFTAAILAACLAQVFILRHRFK
jgi:hypothetical protein